MADMIMSHSPILSVEQDENSPHPLSDGSSLKSVTSSGSEHSLDKIGGQGTATYLLNESDKKLKHVGFLIGEMIETESTYVHALDDVIEGYIKRLRRDSSSGFSDEIIDRVFVNIEEIRDFHNKLLQHLLQCESKHELVAQLFIDNIHKFSDMYIGFCSAFPQSLAKLYELHNVDPYKSALSQCQRELGHIFPVEEYLHRAVQRFLKYPLLFKDMAKKLISLEGHDIVQEALDKLLVTAVKINSVKRVQELQSQELVGWKGGDLKCMGDLLLEDSFKVVGAKDPRYLFLFKDCMLITKKKEQEGTFLFKHSITMNDITLKEQVDTDFLKWSLLIGKGSDFLTISAKDLEQKDRWIREVKRCIVYSTPGLTDIQKEAFLRKLPSLKHDVEHINSIWKRANKKSKKAVKRAESVRILHNTDCDSDAFSINSEISSAFDIESPTPSIGSNRSLSRDFSTKSSDNAFNRRVPVVKKRVTEDDVSLDGIESVQVGIPVSHDDTSDSLDGKNSVCIPQGSIEDMQTGSIEEMETDSSFSLLHDVMNSLQDKNSDLSVNDLESRQVENLNLDSDSETVRNSSSEKAASESILEVTEQMIEASEPVISITTVSEASKPVPEPVIEIPVLIPVVEISEPVTKESELVLEKSKPVIEKLEPVIEILEPKKLVFEVSEPLEELSGTGMVFEEPPLEVSEPISQVSIADLKYTKAKSKDSLLITGVTVSVISSDDQKLENEIHDFRPDLSNPLENLPDNDFTNQESPVNESEVPRPGSDGLLGCLLNRLLENQYCPGNLFALFYFSICAASLLPWYYTATLCIAILVVKFFRNWIDSRFNQT